MADHTKGLTETYEFPVYTSSGWDKRTYTYTIADGNLADSAASSFATCWSSRDAYNQARDKAWSLDLKSWPYNTAKAATNAPAT